MAILNANETEQFCSATLQLRCDVNLRLPRHLGQDDEALKEWVWSNHKDAILGHLVVHYESDDTRDDKAANPKGYTDASVGLEHVTSDASAATTASTVLEPTSRYSAEKRLDLLATMVRIHRQFFDSESSKTVFSFFLEAILDIMDSEYGFIGEVMYEEDSTMYLQCHAITNIAWDQATMQFYNDNIEHGMRFYNLNTLFGTVMTTGRPVISNSPSSDTRAGGVPDGHPPLNHFLGIPFFKSNGELYGMVGLSNKPGGYSEQDIEFLEPVTVLCANLIQIYMQREQNHCLINSLEESVKARTGELERANSHLEDANRRIRRASEQQLEHFACMSHEIRTPLNCIIGMGSLLKGSKLTTMQEEYIRMIGTSGDLLLAIVNDVLDYSKLETENVDIELKQKSLHDTLFTVVQSIEMKSQGAQSVKTRFDASLPEYVNMDSRRILQVLFNLLGNAAKFSPQGAVIEFSVQLVTMANHIETETEKQVFSTSGSKASRCPFHKAEPQEPSSAGQATDASRCPFRKVEQAETRTPMIRNATPTRLIRFIVKDYGKGIDREDFGRIFEPFQQASSSTEDCAGGTGLGLAITKKLVTAMGGAVSVDSVKGSWTAFTVDLPCFDEPAPTLDLAKEMQHWKVWLIGASDEDKENLFRIFRHYKLDFAAFDALHDAQDALQQSCFSPKNCVNVVMARSEGFDSSEYQALMSKCPNLTTVTFGPSFCSHEGLVAHHFRSLDQILPCVLMKTLIATVASKATATAPSESRPSTQSFPQLRVLVAEDNLVNQKVLAGMLSRLGVKHVDIVENGLKACEREETQTPPYDVILMDQQMPVMGGLEACRRIVSRPGTHKKTPVVFVTAHVSPDFKAECLNAGGSDYIPKPLKMDHIASTFRSICGV